LIYKILFVDQFEFIQEISPGFIFCDVQQEPYDIGRVSDAQVN
jgi:hypothetical protein